MEQSLTKTKNYKPETINQSGQSLVEILIAVSVGAIFIIAAGTLIAVTMRISAQNKFFQPASFLAQDLIDKVTVFAESRWYCPTATNNCLDSGNPPQLANYGIYNIPNKGSNVHYSFKLSALPFQWETGDKTIILNDVSYINFFYVENICRSSINSNTTGLTDNNGSSNTCNTSGGTADPSTQKVTAAVSWNQAGGSGEVKISKYLTRSRNNVFVQTDWSGGPTNPNLEVLTKPNNKFFNSSVIDYDVPGQIQIEEGEIGVGG